MRKVIDTFLHFLADNLQGIQVHPLRQDPNNPMSSIPKANAVNVEFADMEFDTIGAVSAYIDIIHQDSLTAVDWLEKVSAILTAAYYTPLYDYTDPDNPLPTGTNIIWKGPIKFRPVVSDDKSCRYLTAVLLRTID